jgi:hypothetical protein
MKPHRMASLCVLIVALFITSAAAQGTPASSSTERSPEIVVNEFYKWYIHSVSHNIDPLKTDKPTLRKFVTAKLMLKIERIARQMATEDYDSDYFLEAQRDYPDSPALEDKWINNFAISKIVVKGATASLTVRFGTNGELATERVNLTQVAGVWKIDGVKAVLPNPS